MMDTLLSLAGYVARIVYPVLLWLLVFAIVSFVVSILLPSGMDEHPLFTCIVTIFLTVVVMTTPRDTFVSLAGYLPGIVYPLVVWLLVFAVISIALSIPFPSAMDEHPLLTSIVTIILTVVVTKTPRDTFVSLAGYLPGIVYSLVVWLLVFAAISFVISIPLPLAMDEYPLLTSIVTIILTVVVMKTPRNTLVSLAGSLAGYLPGIVYTLVVWLLVFAAISFVISIPLPSAMDEHPFLTFTVTIILTVVVMKAPRNTLVSLAGYIPGIVYTLLVWLLVFAAISFVMNLLLLSAMDEHPWLPPIVTIFLTVVVMTTPRNTLVSLAGYLPGIVYTLLVWLLVFAAISFGMSLLLWSGMDEHPWLPPTVTIFLTVVVMTTPRNTLVSLAGYLPGIVYTLLVWLLVFAAITVAINIVYPLLPLPSVIDKYPLLMFTVTIFLTVALMRTPWDTILGLAGYLLETAYLLLLWLLVFLAISAVVSILVPSAIKEYPDLSIQVTVGLTVVLRIPALGGTILDIVCLLLVWFLLFYSISAVVGGILVPSAAKKCPMFTFVFVVGLTLLMMRVLWGWGTTVQLPARVSLAPTTLPLDELVLDDSVRFAESCQMDLIFRDTEEMKVEHKRDMEKIIPGSNLQDLKHDVLYQGAIPRLVIYTFGVCTEQFSGLILISEIPIIVWRRRKKIKIILAIHLKAMLL
ncbi:uncharacterized protein LOC119329072 [Triticum dicoccoides]|uniref:uncharacterized protein LOC119329072 n=1 Tax=Triticum dicoccoides TaxID=85692 RepID=UPI0018918B53|nr:uncharacterized protein LOC119329072 [Triticum dicoccoides]